MCCSSLICISFKGSSWIYSCDNIRLSITTSCWYVHYNQWVTFFCANVTFNRSLTLKVLVQGLKQNIFIGLKMFSNHFQHQDSLGLHTYISAAVARPVPVYYCCCSKIWGRPVDFMKRNGVLHILYEYFTMSPSHKCRWSILLSRCSINQSTTALTFRSPMVMVKPHWPKIISSGLLWTSHRWLDNLCLWRPRCTQQVVNVDLWNDITCSSAPAFVWFNVLFALFTGSEMVKRELNIPIVKAPYIIHFDRTASFFKAGMPFDVTVSK